MTAYYNEIDPYAAQWLRNLIAAGRIAPGDVDERSIEDVAPYELEKYTQCHFFAGVGVWSYALKRAGWPDDRPAWTGSCPCQPFSSAGQGGRFDDERHLWPAWFHLIEQCRPSVVFGEQVASKNALDWLDLVQADLEGADYDMRTPIHLAAAEGRERIVQFFIDQGIELSPRDRWRRTPLDEAIRHGHARVAELLRKSGACDLTANERPGSVQPSQSDGHRFATCEFESN